jgi:hypothetical protein
MASNNPLISIRTRSLLAIAALLTAACGFGCQPAEAKSPDTEASGGSSSAAVAPTPPANPHAAEEQAAHASADAWLALIDQKQFAQSWDAAAPLFQSSVTKEKWESAVKAAREPLGDVSSRKFRATEYKTSLPGAPPGQYVVVYYETAFAQKQGTTESLTLMKSDDAWKVAGYFVQ